MGKRKGLLLSSENEVWSESAPLPNWSKENLDEVKAQFFLWEKNKETNLYPSLSHAIFSSSHHIKEKAKIPLSGLLMGSIQEMEKEAIKLLDLGFKTVKVKVSDLPKDKTQNFLKDLLLQFQVRIDANQKWSYETAIDFLKPFDPSAFEYVEEPSYEVEKLHSFPWNLALDESLFDLKIETLKNYKNLKALIIKPMLQGMFDQNHPLFLFAKEHSLKIILSSCFETSVGVYQLGKMAQRLGLKDAMGLDTIKYFQKDLLLEPLVIEKGNLLLPEKIKPDLSLLTKL